MDRFAQVLELAEGQLGLVASSQLRELHTPKRTVALWIETRRLRVVRQGVLALAGVPASWGQAVMAAVLAAGEGAVASHLTAGALWGLPNIDRECLEVTTDRPDQRRLRGVITHRTLAFLAREHAVRAGIPVTSVARTLVDCSGRLSVAQLGVATDDALRRGILRLADLRRCSEGLRPAPGRHLKKIHAVLARRLPGYEPGESNLQMRFARDLVAHGLPEPAVEHRVRIGGRRYRIDLAYPSVMLAIEVDGWDVHRTRSAFDHDRARANDLVAAGWTLLRFTASMSETDAARLTSATLVRLGAA
jgi:very-short-patch-repair endonuclease